ncbi:unnamed protein product [Rangifer tarandus platyrhynchus]|uniref:Uncharacterized protein n=2 Tax=Rangifer tarandus platyrhynchus TaxID=3082113 RepID=A0ABN8YUW0_RANTA|nr:unnamed protein product [Rangifer tarandus platyrhynchus]CAI9702866.1 unnamed protein product [Rangifer tarandus platyrhynchus]
MRQPEGDTTAFCNLNLEVTSHHCTIFYSSERHPGLISPSDRPRPGSKPFGRRLAEGFAEAVQPAPPARACGGAGDKEAAAPPPRPPGPSPRGQLRAPPTPPPQLRSRAATA